MTEDEVYQVAEEWAAIFNRAEVTEVEGLIAEAAVDECFDDRTNLFLMSRIEPTDLALVLSGSPGTDPGYLLVRFDGGSWIVDSDPVDWDALEDDAFADEDEDDDDDGL